MSTHAPHLLTFRKMHGAGNDFVVIDSRGRGADAAGVTTPALARAPAYVIGISASFWVFERLQAALLG